MNLRYKLFAAFLGLIIIPLFILGMIMFFVTYNSIEKKYSEQSEYSLKAISYSISNVFNEMDNLTDNGIATSVFHMALSADDPTNQDLTDSEQLSLNASQRNFRSLLFNHPSISYAFLYNFNGKGGSEIVSLFSKDNFSTLPYDKFKESEMYRDVLTMNGVPKWVAPHEYPELTGTEPVFTQIRLVKELSFFQNIGILVVQIKNWEFESIFRNLKVGDSTQKVSFMLVNDDGMILFDPDKDLSGQNFQSFTNKEVTFKKGFQSFKTQFEGEKSIVSMYHLKDHPWSLVSVTSWDSLSREVTIFARWFVVVIFVCFLAALIFNLFFMNRITGEIAVIVRFMRRVEGGDLISRMEEKGNDELTLLAKGYNDLMDKVNNLFNRIQLEQRQKNQAEMRVLQAQIKPHFLFNTLESINVLAVQNEGRKVSEMVYRLASILRITIQDRDEITLEEEIKHLRDYLDIQKFRFEDLFDYEIDIPTELYGCGILKLTLQPLVENSIQHGFEGIPYKGKLSIRGFEERGNLIIRIEDNGIGMNSSQLSMFQYMISESANNEEQGHKDEVKRGNRVHLERRGLGVRSVADRIRIEYGFRHGIFICSSQGCGTIIQCVIPIYEQGEDHNAKSIIG
ncbi:cache domain-containing sensor histidine kinase [Paenibacillus macquariensis]|uniref:Histidine kinase-, DNA gyrase B-, and HSP90-like ATPase n=1 Tax=Paenibacillus macquariensis TaxID=948756 RepID=A0ABY1K2A7_9BACL|nr:sensor histidine kinase [Paenibacillus macquariensis]MEC0091644.1 sensor histidine kinase [Paenibacillus macquariensis]OAB32425.1 two-component sensor histidine kinase [Paenibacillus macquariensis subsp. macquariensis]SIR14823.1 Histidine kinase-, DNA gyrase B-, and HSP90-like ATPase [Paenibacillus macquariensis]